MKLKKIVMLLLTVVLVMSSLIGCGKAKDDATKETSTDTTQTDTKTETKKDPEEKKEEVDPLQEPQKLDLAAFEGGYGRQYWDDVVEQFKADYPNADVTLTINPNIVDIVRPRLVAGDAPDYIYAGDLDALLLGDNALLPLNDVFESESLDGDGIKLGDKILPGFLDACSPLGDGNIYFAPVNMSVLGMYYNKGLFEEKGWDVPETWDEWFAMKDKAAETNRALYTYQGQYPVYNEFILGAMMASSAGIDEVNKLLNYEEDAWAASGIKDSLDVFGKIADEDLLLEGTVAMNHTQAQTAFLQGKAMFIPCGTWIENEMKEVEPEEGFAYGFMPAPRVSSGDDSYLNSHFARHYIPKAAKNPAMAKQFMKYHYKKENIQLKAELTTAVMPVVGGTELAKPYISQSMYDALSAFETYDAKPLSFIWKVVSNVEVKVNEEFWNAINSLMNKEISVDEWIERVQKANATVREAMLAE